MVRPITAQGHLSMFVVHRLPSTAFLSRSISSTPAVLSGHNKWSKIKAKKAVNDAAKAAIYTKARSVRSASIRPKDAFDGTHAFRTSSLQ